MLKRFLNLRLYVWFTAAFVLRCGNPAIQNYLIQVSYNDPKLDQATANLTVKSTVAKKPEKTMKIYEKNGVSILLITLEAEEIDTLAENLDLYSSQRYYRLPGLTYLKYQIENKSGKTIQFKLLESWFENELKQKFEALHEKEYVNFYTSTAYSRFDYMQIYSFFVTKRDDKEKNGKVFYYKRFSPNEKTELYDNSSGFQIVPYRLLSPGARYYLLTLSEVDPQNAVSIPFVYCTIREDMDRCAH